MRPVLLFLVAALFNCSDRPSGSKEPAKQPESAKHDFVTQPESAKQPETLQRDHDLAPPLASMPVISISDSMLRDLAEKVLPLEVHNGTTSLGWITDIVYCGADVTAARASLRVLLCDPTECTHPASPEHILRPAVCNGNQKNIPATRHVMELTATADGPRVALSLPGPLKGIKNVPLPLVQWGDFSFPMRGANFVLDVTVKPAEVRFESHLINVYFRTPPPGFGVVGTVTPAIEARGDEKLQDVASSLGTSAAFVTLPTRNLSELIGRAFARTPQGIPVFTKTLVGGLQVQTNVTSLSLGPSADGLKLVVVADVSSRVAAPGSKSLIDLPAKVTSSFEQHEREITFSELTIEDSYTCTSGCAGSDVVRAAAMVMYADATRESNKAKGAALIPSGRRWRLELKYGSATWSQQFEVLSSNLQNGARHIAFALAGVQ